MDHSLPQPEFRRQLEALRPSEDFPFLGRDPMDHGCAIFVIVHSMRLLGLALKTSTLMLWLGRYEGFERHVDAGNDPVLSVRQVLLTHVAYLKAAPYSPRDRRLLGMDLDLADLWRRIVDDLVALDFVHTRVCWGHPQRQRLKWNPLERSWMDFLAAKRPGEELLIWQPLRSDPDVALACSDALIFGKLF